MRVMDDSYREFGFSFNTLNVTFTVNNAWAAVGQRTQAERDMKTALRQGGYDSLNLYFVGQTSPPNILGWCKTRNHTSPESLLTGYQATSLPQV